MSGIRNAIDKRHDAICIPIALEIAAHVLQADLDAESVYIEGVVSLIVELDLDVAPGEFVKKQRRDSLETGMAGPSVMHWLSEEQHIAATSLSSSTASDGGHVATSREACAVA